jgi:hypothetical protein
VFPLHNLTSALWLEVADECFFTSDSVIQEAMTVPMIQVQNITDIQAATPMLFRELFWKQPCPDFKEVKPVVGNFTGRICS